jgi:hypothetical protein
MTNEEILETAVQKAVDGGWKPGWRDRRPVTKWGAHYGDDFDVGDGVQIIGHHARSSASFWFFPIKELLFDHRFAKSLWGEESSCPGGYHVTGGYCLDYGHGWQYHLQMMVISDDPLKYLGEHMND